MQVRLRSKEKRINNLDIHNVEREKDNIKK
jgi:hypothetical protein